MIAYVYGYMGLVYGLVYGVMRAVGTLADIIRLLGTIHWPFEHIYTQDKSLTSNLGLVYGVMRVEVPWVIS